MTRIPVTSSLLKSVGYDPAAQTLEICFLPRKGATAAPSPGGHFLKHIKGRFAHKQTE